MEQYLFVWKLLFFVIDNHVSILIIEKKIILDKDKYDKNNQGLPTLTDIGKWLQIL